MCSPDALGNDTALREGGHRGPTPLQLARASKWQGEMLSALSAARLEAVALRTALITLNAAQIAQLAALAAPARVLLDFLDRQSPSDRTVWSALRSRAVLRVAALAKLAEVPQPQPLPLTGAGGRGRRHD